MIQSFALLITYINFKGIAILVINLIGTIFIEYTWDACYLCAVESMPTSMRASSLGSCSFIARIGALFSPTVSFTENLKNFGKKRQKTQEETFAVFF